MSRRCGISGCFLKTRTQRWLLVLVPFSFLLSVSLSLSVCLSILRFQASSLTFNTLTNPRFAMSSSDGIAENRGPFKAQRATRTRRNCPHDGGSIVFSNSRWISLCKMTSSPISVTKVSSENADLEIIPFWDCTVCGIIVLCRKNQWDNFSPGSKIYYYEARRTKKFNYPAPGTASGGGLGNNFVRNLWGKGGLQSLFKI